MLPALLRAPADLLLGRTAADYRPELRRPTLRLSDVDRLLELLTKGQAAGGRRLLGNRNWELCVLVFRYKPFRPDPPEYVVRVFYVLLYFFRVRLDRQWLHLPLRPLPDQFQQYWTLVLQFS